MAIDGTIRIHRSIGGTGAAFRVSFVPYDTDGETTAAVRSFHEVQQVRAFLKSLGVPAQISADALRQLAAGRSASISQRLAGRRRCEGRGFGGHPN